MSDQKQRGVAEALPEIENEINIDQVKTGDQLKQGVVSTACPILENNGNAPVKPYVKIEPKDLQENPTTPKKQFNIKVPTNLAQITGSKKKPKRDKSIEEMNTHIKVVEVNIPKGQFLPNPPRLAPVLQPIMSEEMRIEKEKENRKRQQLFRELIGNQHIFAEDLQKPLKQSKSAFKIGEDAQQKQQPTEEYFKLKKDLKKQTTDNEAMRKKMIELQAEKDAYVEAVGRYKELFDKQISTETKINFAFLYANPIFYEDGKKKRFPDSISFEKEVKIIKTLARQTNAGILFKKTVATKRSFDEILANEPKIIHISCHGLLEAKKKNPNQKIAADKSQNEMIESLLFEEAAGKGERVTKTMLQGIVDQNGCQIDLVYLAACTSQFVGEMFHEFGVNHVVCVKRREYVKDQAAIDFTRIFYLQLFQGKPICDAFSFAKASVKFNHKVKDADMFTLFTKNKEKHVCFPLNIDYMSAFKNCTDLTLIKQLPYKSEHLQGRENDLYDMNQLILRDSDEKCSVATVLGCSGIGKSLLIRTSMKFIQQRKEFAGGVILVQLRGVKRVETMMLILMQLVYSKCAFDKQQLRARQQQAVHSTGKMQVICNFLNLLLPLKSRDPENRILKNNKILLCLDNADALIIQNSAKLRQFLSQLTQLCPKVKILLTSTVGLQIEESGEEETQKLLPDQKVVHALEPKNTILLFLHKSEAKIETISDDHLIDFIRADNNQEQTERKEMRKLVKASFKNDDRIKLLINHELFTDLLKGNPQLISLLAQCFKMANADPSRKDRNHLLDVYTQLRDKIKIYKTLNSNKDDAQAQPDQPSEEDLSSVTDILLNELRVQCETQAKYENDDKLRETQELIKMLGKLPGGVKLSELRQIWQDHMRDKEEKDVKVDVLVDRLREMELLGGLPVVLQPQDEPNNEQPAVEELKPLSDDQLIILNFKLPTKQEKTKTDESETSQICNVIANFYNQMLSESCQAYKAQLPKEVPSLEDPIKVIRRGGGVYDSGTVVNLERCFDYCTENMAQDDITYNSKEQVKKKRVRSPKQKLSKAKTRADNTMPAYARFGMIHSTQQDEQVTFSNEADRQKAEKVHSTQENIDEDVHREEVEMASPRNEEGERISNNIDDLILEQMAAQIGKQPLNAQQDEIPEENEGTKDSFNIKVMTSKRQDEKKADIR